jgi:hypothetical protein
MDCTGHEIHAAPELAGELAFGGFLHVRGERGLVRGA